ncbi:hypothetical protein HMI54_001664 [Coelomomyces lativittatus]|nr:hypothetical protein HMI54_001664 [Coelomomyces lativittatus]
MFNPSELDQDLVHLDVDLQQEEDTLTDIHHALNQLNQQSQINQTTLNKFKSFYQELLHLNITHGQSRLQAFGIDTKTFSFTLKHYLQTLVEIALELNLDTVLLSSYQCALTNRLLEEHAQWQKEYEQQLHLKEIQEAHGTLLKVKEELQTYLTQLNEDTMENLTLEQGFQLDLMTLHHKAKDYQTQLNNPNPSSSSYQHPLKKIRDYIPQLNSLEKEYRHVQEQLTMYQSIPPDQQLVELELKKAKLELKENND